MSAIRPDLPSTLFPTAPQPAAQAARSSDFFRAALAGISPTPVTKTEVAVRPSITTASRSDSTGSAMQRDLRPGSLVDIRV
ncbi:hypothetical protein [Brevundimonas sp.]|uniref:hypothetical protein n=1 Tax=Brevundimonas sp. TaxID=1871086 RepID=UPI0035B4C738